MIVVDASALIAILNGEAEKLAMLQFLSNAADARISVAGVLECTIKGAYKSELAATEEIDALLAALTITTVETDLPQLAIAREAYLRFGKGRGHPAQLNFGDCFAYALAKSLDAPLLFKGEDFRHTDVKVAL